MFDFTAKEPVQLPHVFHFEFAVKCAFECLEYFRAATGEGKIIHITYEMDFLPPFAENIVAWILFSGAKALGS